MKKSEASGDITRESLKIIKKFSQELSHEMWKDDSPEYNIVVSGCSMELGPNGETVRAIEFIFGNYKAKLIVNESISVSKKKPKKAKILEENTFMKDLAEL